MAPFNDCFRARASIHAMRSIGDTSVDDYEDVDVEVREGRIGDAPLGLYPRQVLEEPFGVELVRPYPRDDKGDPITRVNTGGGVIGGVFGDDVPTIETPVVRWTAVDVAEISVLIGLPAGLFRINDDAQIRSRSVAVRIRARLNGVGDWTEVETLTIRAKKRESFVRQFTWSVPVRGRYQVEITRMSDESLETNRADRTILAAIQSIRPEYPLHFDKPLALIAMRIKATAQLNGALDAVNCIAEHEGLVRDGEPVATEPFVNDLILASQAGMPRGPGFETTVSDNDGVTNTTLANSITLPAGDYLAEATVQARVTTAGTAGVPLRGSVSLTLQDNLAVAYPELDLNYFGMAEHSALFFFADASQTFGRMNDITRQSISLAAPAEVFMRFGLQVFNTTDPAQDVTFELLCIKFTPIKELPITV